MGCNTKVINLTSEWNIKRSTAIRRVDQCLSVWVVFGYSIRDLSLQEMVAARSQQATMREPLEWAELPNCVYRPTERNQAQTREGYQLVKAANQFAEMGECVSMAQR